MITALSRRFIALATLAAALPFAGPAVSAASLFTEDFGGYTSVDGGSAPLSATWTPVSGGTVNNLSTGLFKAADAKFSSAYLQIERNTVFQHSLGATSLTGDFSLSARVSVDAYGSSGKQLWFGLFDSAGTHGYAAQFNSQTSGGGVVRLKEFSVASAGDLTYSLAGTNLTTSAAASGLSSAIADTALMTLKWESLTGTLTLLVNGDVKLSTTLSSPITGFNYLYFGGVSGAQFDDISLATAAIPEPAVTASLFASSGLLLAALAHLRRHR